MPVPALTEYLKGIDSTFAPLVRRIHRAVMAAETGFDTRVSYHMLMYTLEGDFRNWICAIGVTRKGACLRFLYGVLLQDPRGLLRGGTSILKSLDIASAKDFDAGLITGYVQDAVSRHADFRAKSGPHKSR
jgi:hypothetical protein